MTFRGFFCAIQPNRNNEISNDPESWLRKWYTFAMLRIVNFATCQFLPKTFPIEKVHNRQPCPFLIRMHYARSFIQCHKDYSHFFNQGSLPLFAFSSNLVGFVLENSLSLHLSYSVRFSVWRHAKDWPFFSTLEHAVTWKVYFFAKRYYITVLGKAIARYRTIILHISMLHFKKSEFFFLFFRSVSKHIGKKFDTNFPI